MHIAQDLRFWGPDVVVRLDGGLPAGGAEGGQAGGLPKRHLQHPGHHQAGRRGRGSQPDTVSLECDLCCAQVVEEGGLLVAGTVGWTLSGTEEMPVVEPKQGWGILLPPASTTASCLTANTVRQ